MAKRTAKCNKCSGLLEKEHRKEEFCQYCQLKRKIELEIKNMQKLFEESGDPDIARQLEELETMSSELQKKRDIDVEMKKESNLIDIPVNQSIKEEESVNKKPKIESVEGENECDEEKKPDFDFVKEELVIDDEDYLKSLPKNWSARNVRVGFGSIIKHFVDPTGKRYVSRIDAIRALSKLGDRQEDVFTLRTGLQADGWISHPFLPDGWYAKPACKPVQGSSNCLRFLTDKNEWFVGIKKAVKLLNNSEEYTGLDLDNLHAFYGMLSSFKRENDGTWLDGDEILPEGWRYKVAHGPNGDYAKVLSPNGDAFSSKSKALAHMVKNKFDEEDIQKMKAALVYDGWTESSFLPPEWRYRKCKVGRNEYNFLSPEGEMFPSRKTLVEFLSSSEKYSIEDINNLDALKEEIRAKWVQDNHNWIEDDPTVPQGWKIRYFESMRKKKLRKRCYILSPSGTVFQTRVKALQFMIQKCHPDDQIAYMRTQLEKEGWCSHPMLPENWRIKRKLIGKGYLFFSAEGTITSLKGALEHIEKASNKYSAEDSEGLVFVAKGYTEHLTKQNYEWLESETVPDGWKMRTFGTFGREYFLSPSGVEIVGRIKTIQSLLKQGLPDSHSDIQILRSGLENVGWKEDLDTLPRGWMKKQVIKSKNSVQEFKYISPDFKEFNSLTRVYHYMRANGFPSTVVNNVQRQLDVKSILSNRRVPTKLAMERLYKWQEADYLPEGWKMATKKLKYGEKKNLFLTPSGLLLKKAVIALQLMVEDGVDNEYVDQMYNLMSEEGWEEDSELPEGWRINVNKKQFPQNFIDEENVDVLFITEKAKILTRTEALEQLSDGKEFDADQVNGFLSLLDDLDNGLERGWKEDPTLPEGWRVRIVDLGYKRDYRLITPDQEEFDSISTAFLYMMSNQDIFEDGDILKMKTKLFEEGFEENDKLPGGWRIIRNRGGNLFELLSKEGILYQTLESAQEFMERSEDYEDKHVLDLEDLCMAEVESYLNNRVVSNPGVAALGDGSESPPVKEESMKEESEGSVKVRRKRKLTSH